MPENECLSLVLFAKKKKSPNITAYPDAFLKFLKIFTHYDYYSRATQ